ncbi:XdhC family protein [Halobacteria archaeon AArc-dxtr1]|nr:XdhC family protein [Halobacteria archaeon AArc-dxtr1]
MTRRNWSVPETAVVQRVRERIEAASDEDVLATIVDVEGSAYRRPGAKMLLDEAGGIGSITAGCLEDELLRVAEEVRAEGRPKLVTYDLMEDDEDDVWGLGVGCNGIIEVLLEPLSETYRPAVAAFDDGRDVGICTVLSTPDGDPLERGDRAYYHPENEGRLSTPDGEPATDWPSGLESAAAELASSGKADVVDLDSGNGTLEIFVDGLAAPEELVIFGTGHDVGPVTELAAKNDFRVTVVGFRGAVDLAEKFPDADQTLTTSPGTIAADFDAAGVDLDERTHAVVMTHNFIDDRLAVEALIDADVPYVGLMGPNERFAEMVEVFEEEGRTFDEGELKALYTPIGLDLGGGSPYQIAHSIVAEVLAVSNDRQPRHLRTREGHIHDRVEVEADD